MEFELTWKKAVAFSFLAGVIAIVAFNLRPTQYQVNCVSPVGVVFMGASPMVKKAYVTTGGAVTIQLQDDTKFTTTGSVCNIVEKRESLFGDLLNTSD